MMTKEVKYLSLRELRQFGIGLSLLLGVIGTLFLCQGRSIGAAVLFGGLLVVLAFWFGLPGARTIYTVWMKIAVVVARAVTLLLLTLLYCLLLTPLGFLGRLCGHRFIEKTFRGEGKTYWSTRNTVGSLSSSEKQS